ncbi:MAG: hypothetical protein GY761_02860 [Hyphomicrobiales bacterium]|nr:hypothetical protein [Hyphomicrobiales bacterium]
MSTNAKPYSMFAMKEYPSGFFAGLAVFILVAFGIIIIDMIDGKVMVIGIDDWMREMQIRDLLADGNWRDMAQPYLQMPQIYISPWSRIVDFPYVIVTKLFSMAIPQQLAVKWAFLIVPPVMLLGFCAMVYALAFDVIGQSLSTLAIMIMALVMLPAILQFAPGRIDHHNMQLLAFTGAIWGVMHKGITGGIVVGLVCAISIGIGLETLPLIVGLYGALTLAWIGGEQGSGAMLKFAAITISIGTLIFAWLRHGSALLQVVECDAISLPYVMAAIVCGGILALCVQLENVVSSPRGRLALITIAGVIMVVALATAFPQCLQGPYAKIDASSRSFWLNYVPGEMDVFTGLQKGQKVYFYFLLPAAIISTMFIPVAYRRYQQGDWHLAVLVSCAIVALTSAIIQLRFFIFPVVLAAILVPAFVSFRLRNKQLQSELYGSKRLVVGVIGVAILAGLLSHLLSGPALSSRELYTLHYEECEGESFSVLTQVKPGRVIAPMGLSKAIAEGNYGHSVAALPFHRASPGISRVAKLFTSANIQVRQQAMAPFDYLAVCQVGKITNRDVAPLLVALMQGETVDGLSLIVGSQASRFQLFHIKQFPASK